MARLQSRTCLSIPYQAALALITPSSSGQNGRTIQPTFRTRPRAVHALRWASTIASEAQKPSPTPTATEVRYEAELRNKETYGEYMRQVLKDLEDEPLPSLPHPPGVEQPPTTQVSSGGLFQKFRNPISNAQEREHL